MQNLTSYLMITTAMVMMPGTDTTVVVKNTLKEGNKGGYATILGIISGLVVHTLAAVVGLSAIIASSSLLFEIIKYAGVAYLLYVGIITLFSTPNGLAVSLTAANNEGVTDSGNVSSKSSYIQGLYSNVLNPKSFIFYFTFLPQFVDVHANYFTQLILLAGILMLVAAVWFTILTFAIDRFKHWLKNPVIIGKIQRILGVMLIVFAVRLVL